MEGNHPSREINSRGKEASTNNPLKGDAMSRKNDIRIVNAIKSANFQSMVANGTAPGVASRARTMRSGRDKAQRTLGIIPTFPSPPPRSIK